MATRPGGEMATRPLHFIWIADCSGSMAGEKIQTLNFAIREAIPAMQEVAGDNPYAQVLVRALKFSSGAQWHISQPTDVKDFKWMDLSADGVTDLGAALKKVAEVLKVSVMGDRALPPVLVLLSDGVPTDDYSSGLKALMDEPWGKKAVRVAIACGEQDVDLEVLQKFIGHKEIKPLVANSAPELVKYIKWASTAVLKAASSPASQVKGTADSGMNVPLPKPPDAGPADAGDVW
jgi:uncharacterized protein YegL